MTCSLLISTYNWPEALRQCLQSIEKQIELPDEIIICDDGSGPETKKTIDEFRPRIKSPIIHVWHEDEGFQLAKIRNKGIASARSDYIIQIDGDLILDKNFIKDHKLFSRSNCFVTGSRVLLSEATTGQILMNQNRSSSLRSYKERNWSNGLRAPILRDFLANKYKTKGKHKYYVKGCNMAFWKKDLQLVNGYNEAFIGWGREDSEIAIRLINAGIRKRFIKFGGICYHLYHKEAARELEKENVNKMNLAIKDKLVKSPKGLDQYGS